MIAASLAGLRTHIPAQVVSYDAATNTVSVQPCIQVIRSEDPTNLSPRNLPVLENVPVRQYGSGKLFFTVAPAVDSYGVLHIMDRDLHRWLSSGGIVYPGASRKFDLSDAIFEPGILPYVDDGDNGQMSEPVKTDRISLRTRSGLTEVSVCVDESIAINVNDGAAAIEIDSDGNIVITTTGDIGVTADGDITIEGASIGITGALDVNGNLTVAE
jgi:hypothetical protein